MCIHSFLPSFHQYVGSISCDQVLSRGLTCSGELNRSSLPFWSLYSSGEDKIRKTSVRLQMLEGQPRSSVQAVTIMSLMTPLPYSGSAVKKNLSANARVVGDAASIPGWGRSPGGGNGNPLQYSFLGNLMDRRTWRATVHWVAKSQTRLSMHARMHFLSE